MQLYLTYFTFVVLMSSVGDYMHMSLLMSVKSKLPLKEGDYLHHGNPCLAFVLTNCILYLCRFADTEVRSVAVSWIEKSSDDELADYLPQLVQVLRELVSQVLPVLNMNW